MIFLNKAAIARELNQVPDGSHVIVDMSKTVFVDYDVKELIDKFIANAPVRNIKVDTVSNRQEGDTEPHKKAIETIN